MNWEIGIDMYTLMCIKWMTNKNLLCICVYILKKLNATFLVFLFKQRTKGFISFSF